MTAFRRFALFAVPEGDLYRAGASWLGWDSVDGKSLPHPQIAGLDFPVDRITARARKYGFHGTLKPPFRLRHGATQSDLEAATSRLSASLAPVTLPRLDLRRMGGFLALVPSSDCPPLSALAAAVVTGLDRYREAPGEAELARRRKAGLSERQEAMLAQWGYPYVLEEFRFHLTLTGWLGADTDRVAQSLQAHVAPALRRPFAIDSLCLMGEDEAGHFHVHRRFALTG